MTTKRRSVDRERILEVAFEVIAETGLDGFTMTEVERRVGLAVGTGSIYRHFPSKEALVREAVEREVSRNRSALRDARSIIEQLGDPEARRSALYKQFLEQIGRFDRIFGLMLTQGDRLKGFQETIRATVQPDEPPLTGEDRGVHVVAMAALGGYHLFSVMQGGPFHGVSQAEFLDLVAELTASLPHPVGA